MEPSLRVYHKDTVIFESNRNWIYPLFDLNKLLETGNYNPAHIYVRDKVVGKAAALLIIYMGIRKLDAGILSELAREQLEKHHIDYTCDTEVERIQCKTEDLLKNEDDPARAYQLLAQRAASNLK